MTHVKNLAVALILSLIVIAPAAAGQVWTDNHGVAIKGYDVVSYFTEHQARRGSQAHSMKHNGATYYFTSAANQQAFQKNPKKYLPQYEGYCAFGVAKQMKRVPSDPRTFKISNGKLLLFFNDFYKGQVVNTIVPWNQNEAMMSASAERNWKTMNR